MILAFFGALAVVFAVLMLFQRTLYGSAMCVLLVLVQVAAMLFVLGAQLVALMQMLVYAGAIMVLIVVAVMAAPPRLAELWAPYRVPGWMPPAVLALLGLELALIGLAAGPLPAPEGLPLSARALEREMAGALFGGYAVVTEVVGLLILVASLAVVPPAEARPPEDRGA